MDMASEPQYVFGAATLGHQHVKSSQHTLPMANDAGRYQAEKIKKPLTGYLYPLTTGGLISFRPYSCRALAREPVQLETY
jgi:phage protein U